MLKAGQQAPDIVLEAIDGLSVRAAAPGRPIVVTFFPKAFSPICTAQTCAFRDRIGEFEGLGAEVFAVSRDDDETMRRFKDKLKLTFPLVADADGTVTIGFGAALFWGLVPASIRATFVITAEGRIVMAYRRMTNAEAHATKALAALRRLAG